MMTHHLLNLTLLLQIIQRLACQRTIDLQPVHERGHRDEAIGLHILVELIRGGLIEHDGVVGLVLDCFEGTASVGQDTSLDPFVPSAVKVDVSHTFSFGPLLLLLLATSRCGCL